jgi:hypothetical protein
MAAVAQAEQQEEQGDRQRTSTRQRTNAQREIDDMVARLGIRGRTPPMAPQAMHELSPMQSQGQSKRHRWIHMYKDNSSSKDT